MYRVHHRLSRGEQIIERGSFTTLNWLNEKGIERLLAKGSVSRIEPPPLIILPGWTVRAEKLQEHDIVNAEQFLDTPDFVLAEHLNASERAVQRWREELETWLSGETPRS